MPAASASSTAASVSSGRRHRHRGDRTGRQHRVAAVGEHRHAGGLLHVGARRGAADDVGAVGAHQRRMRAAHAAGDALHDDRRVARGWEAPSPSPLPQGEGECEPLPLPLREGVGGGGRSDSADPPQRLLQVLGDEHRRLPLGQDAPRLDGTATDQPRHHGHTQRRRLLHRRREQSGELGQIGDAGEDVDQHRPQRRARRDPLQHAHQRAPDCRASGRCGCRRSSAACCRARSVRRSASSTGRRRW